MQKHDETQQAAELRRAFLRHLPKRLETLRKRGYRLCTQGWDINALSLLFREIQTLSGTCGRNGLLDLSEHLFSLESLLTPFVEEVSIRKQHADGSVLLAVARTRTAHRAPRTTVRRNDDDASRRRAYRRAGDRAARSRCR